MLSNLVVCYLFLGGLGGGACMVLSVLGLLSPRDAIAAACSSRGGAALANAAAFSDGSARLRANASVCCQPVVWRFAPVGMYRRLFVSGHTASLIALALGAFCLVADLARSDRVALLFLSPTPTFITMGTWLLVAALSLTCVTLLMWGSANGARFALVRIVQALSCVVGLGVILYTGLLLQGIAAVPLWATPWLPILFVLSSASCGVALVLLSSYAAGALSAFESVMRRLLTADILVIALEALATILLVAASLHGVSPLNAANGLGFANNPTDAAAIASAGELLCGANAWVFWLCFVATGLVIPLILECISLNDSCKRPAIACVIACCVLLGGFAMRYCVIMAGLHPVAVSAMMFLG